MLNRRLALTFVKNKDAAADSAGDTTTLQQAGETIVDTVAGVGTVVVVVASTMTVLRITEHVVRHIFR